MSKRRKILLVLASILGVLIIIAGTALYIIGRDESPPDDSMLVLQRAEISEDQNGYTYIVKAGKALYWPGTEAWKAAGSHPVPDEDALEDEPAVKAADEIRKKVEAMEEGREWDDALAADIISHNKEALELIQQALACPQWQRAKPVGFDDLAGDEVFTTLHAARMLSVRSWALAREGKDEAALEQAIDTVRMGRGMEQSKGLLVSFLVGLTVRNIGLQTTRSLLKTSTVPPDRLKALADQLGSCVDNSQALADTYRVEYEWGQTVLDESIKKGEGIVATGQGTTPLQMKEWGGLTGYGFLYRPNETRRLFVDAFRPAVEAAGKPYSEVHLPDARKEIEGNLVQRVLRGNVVGRSMYAIMWPATFGALEQKCRSKTEAGVTQALIALKAFKAKTGRLPQSLDELVPEYLPSVPLDNFDGKPIRYSPAKKVLYTVGKDLKDEGGMTRDEAREWWQKNKPDSEVPLEEDEEVPVRDLPDPSFQIEF
jgi:hypothetical protein